MSAFPPVVTTIGPEGGSVEAGDIRLDVPPGALASAVEIEVKPAQGSETVPTAPVGIEFLGEPAVFLPHGLSFAAPVTVALPAPEGTDRILRADDGDATTWEQVSGVTIGSGKATFAISGFSLYVAARPAAGVPAARGLLAPPVVVGGSIHADFIAIDPESGFAYWTWARPDNAPGRQLVRAQLRENALVLELVYESDRSVSVLAVGPEAVYFREDDGLTTRLTHDLTDVRPDWGETAGLASLTQGIVGANHVYFGFWTPDGIPAKEFGYRIPLAGGAVEETPVVLPVYPSTTCALDAARKALACSLRLFDLEGQTGVIIYGDDGRDVSNGRNAVDSEAFYFTPQHMGRLYRLPHGSSEAHYFGDSRAVQGAAAFGGKLYLGHLEADGLSAFITTYDAQNATELAKTPIAYAPNAVMLVVGDYLYHGIFAGTLERIRLSDLD